MPILSTIGRQAVKLSEPLPVRNSIFSNAGLTFRKGQFSLVLSAPAVGKTNFALNMAVFTNVDVLYFSADSDEWTVLSRAIALVTGEKINTVVDHMGDPAWDDYYSAQLGATDHIDFCYRTDIDLEFMANRVLAHEEIYGKFPDLIVLDNLDHTVEDQANEFVELRGTCKELQRIARDTEAHVMALHHVQGSKTDGWSPINMGDSLGKLEKIPEIVLGLSRDSDDRVLLSVPKNRTGRSGLQFGLPLDYATAKVGGWNAA